MMLVEETTVSLDALPLTALKDHLRLGSGFAESDLQDNVLESFLRAAIAAIEARTGKILLERVFTWSVHSVRDPARTVLPVAPVSAIAGVTEVDADGGESLVDALRWRLQPDPHQPCLMALDLRCHRAEPCKSECWRDLALSGAICLLIWHRQ